MELKETVEMMQSKEYKERFKAEYFQTRIRYEKLKAMLNNWNNLNFTPNCPKSILLEQCKLQEKLLQVLESRTVYEDIDLGVELLSPIKED